MRHHHDIFPAFHLHYDGFEAGHDVAVGLTALVAVVIPEGVSDWEKRGAGVGKLLVVVASLEVFRVTVLDFFVGKAIANSCIKLV